MGRRLQLQAKFIEILGSGNVYFQPPANVQMEYPCILYKRDTADTKFAGNLPYRFTQRYMVTIIDQNPDSEIPGKVAALPTCIFDRWYAANNLNHDVYVLYF
jgi:hypothetical protein